MLMRCCRMKALGLASHLTQRKSRFLNYRLGRPEQVVLPFCTPLLPIPCALPALPWDSPSFKRTPGLLPAGVFALAVQGWWWGVLQCSPLAAYRPFLSRDAFPEHLIKACILSPTSQISSLLYFSPQDSSPVTKCVFYLFLLP